MKKRVVAYCRVSTDKDDQRNSLQNQKQYFEHYIKEVPDWEFIDLYVDEGLSGTSTKKRTAFNKMLADAKAGKFDLVLSKEVSRFGRNTLDTLSYVRELKALGIGVIFQNDNINTLDPESELRLTIMSSIAQEESRKTSDRVKWGQKRRMEQGVVFGNTVLGYTIEGGKLHIKPDEAETVRLIFNKYLNEGKGLHVIAKELMRDGILTSCKGSYWDSSAVVRVLRNEKYCGDLKQRKSYTPDYLSPTSKKNKGEEEFIIIKDNHEPIVSRDVFDRTQAEIERRTLMFKNNTRHSTQCALSGKLKCGLCGASFVSRARKGNGGRRIQRWQCANNYRYGHRHVDKAGNTVGCENMMIRQEILEYAVTETAKNIIGDMGAVVKGIIDVLGRAVEVDGCGNEQRISESKLVRLENKKLESVELFLERAIDRETLGMLNKKYDVQIEGLKEKLDVIERQKTTVSDGAIEKYIAALIGEKSLGETVVREIVERIDIYSKTECKIYFKDVSEGYRCDSLPPRFVRNEGNSEAGRQISKISHVDRLKNAIEVQGLAELESDSKYRQLEAMERVKSKDGMVLEFPVFSGYSAGHKDYDFK